MAKILRICKNINFLMVWALYSQYWLGSLLDLEKIKPRIFSHPSIPDCIFDLCRGQPLVSQSDLMAANLTGLLCTENFGGQDRSVCCLEFLHSDSSQSNQKVSHSCLPQFLKASRLLLIHVLSSVIDSSIHLLIHLFLLSIFICEALAISKQII